MKTLLMVVAATVGIAASAYGVPVYGLQPSWESADRRATYAVVLADFNGDGWQYETAETKTGDGESHVYYLNHWPALTINRILINGEEVPRSDYCFDAGAGWYSFKDAPGPATLIAVNYVWSDSLDLFAGNDERETTDGRDVIYFNRGGRLTRTAGWRSEQEDNVFCAAAADFDADGDMDLAVGCMFPPKAGIKLYRNTGEGLEAQPSWEVPAVNPYCLAWGDADNDGLLELAVADSGLCFLIFKNVAGELEQKPCWYGYSDGPAWSVAWGDADADGDMDLAGATYVRLLPAEHGYAHVFLNNDDNPLLEVAPSWHNDPPIGRCGALAWGDVNGDGWLDLVKGIVGGGGEETDCYADIYYSDHGVLSTAPGWESAVNSYNRTSCLVDADADGRLDLIQASSGTQGFFWKGDTLSTTPRWRYGPGNPFQIYDIDVGDINGDGYWDAAVAVTAMSDFPRGHRNVVFLNKANIGIDVKGFAASACDRGVALRWGVNEEVAGFNIFREVMGAATTSEPFKINADLITGESPYRYLDEAVEPGNIYKYWLEVVPLAGAAEWHGPVECTTGVKAAFALSQNYPNPARDATTVTFSLATSGEAAVTIYDISGRRVKTAFAGPAKAGDNEISVDVSTLAPGVYTYRLEAGGKAAARKLVVVE
jgi:hypothetical protein